MISTHSVWAKPATSARKPLAGRKTLTYLAALVALVALTVLPVTSTAAAGPAPLLGYGQVGTRQAVPWSEVGAGWILAQWQAVPPKQAGTAQAGAVPSSATPMLYLIDPAGGRYDIGPVDVAGSLSDWSGDGEHALLVDSQPGKPYVVTDLDLATGLKVGQFQLSASLADVFAGFTRPAGTAILLEKEYVGLQAEQLERVSPTGSAQLTYPSNFAGAGSLVGGFLETPNGLQLVLGAQRGLVLVDNDGQAATQLSVPGAPGCQPTSWWAPGIVLANCLGDWLVPISGARPTLLAKQGSGPAWKIGATTYITECACGSCWIAKLEPNGTAEQVNIPRVNNYLSVYGIGAYGGRLALMASLGCDGGKPGPGGRGPSLMWYDPVDNTVSVVLGPPVNGGMVDSAYLYGADQVGL
ncbi:MAG TPA: hypothetical protein VME46_17850 [Acidimicrobiales bacterium]|nr:hypothetical protein [Acidimicrobiales bacterium]